MLMLVSAAAAFATSTAATAAAVVAETTAGWAGFHRGGNVHLDGTAIEILAVGVFAGVAGFLVRSESHKTKALAATGHFVHRHKAVCDLPPLGEELH